MRLIPPFVAGCLLALALSASCATGSAGSLRVRADNGGTAFVVDSSTVVTVSPNGDGYRDEAVVHVSVSGETDVEILASRHGSPGRTLASARRVAAGEHSYRWRPPARPVPASYTLRIRAGSETKTVVVRVQGIDAAFGRAAYHPGDTARVAVATDAEILRAQVIRITGAAPVTRRNDRVQGTPIGRGFRVRIPGRGDRPHALAVPIGKWPSGVYFLRLTSTDGRTGYAPFILRPHPLGRNRVAVVMPTYTWQAYNFYDRDGDGRGDTWYAGWRSHTTRLGRPCLNRGVPAHFNTYDLPFLRWFAREGLEADFLSDADLGSIGSGDRLARLYDLVVFPGHHEYVTASEYDVVQRYRDLGGNLAWLSANNFFWKVVRHGPVLERVVQWRRIGRPEAALIGVQYHGNDEGERRAPMVVRGEQAVSWLFNGTGLHDGDTFGNFGIEIDARAAASPAGTQVVAGITSLYGENIDAEMTFYETAAGAKVFAAGAFTLAGLADSRTGSQLLRNLLSRLGAP